jgi:CRISPR-associated protein Cas2
VRRIYIVAYDISHPKRLRKVFKTLKGFGDHLQLSVFRCDIDDGQRVRLEARLRDIIEPAEDQVIFVDLGPTDGRRHVIVSLGRPVLELETRGARVF